MGVPPKDACPTDDVELQQRELLMAQLNAVKTY